MKKFLSVICAIALLMQCIMVYPVQAQAAEVVESGTCGENLTWTLDDDGTLTISGIGPMTDYDWGESPWSYNNGIKRVIIEEGVTSIGDRAIFDCDNMTSVTIPGSVTSIGSGVFDSCFSLTGIWVDENNPNYSNDESGVLFNKDKTTLLVAPDMLSDHYDIPDSVTHIYENAISECRGLTSVTIPDSVTYIGDSAFFDCSGLTSIVIPDSVTRINSSVFSYCSGLTSIVIPDSVTYISFVFSYCSGLTSVTIPDSVTYIDTYAFSGCSGLNGIWVDENNSHYCSDENGVLFDKEKTTLIIVPGGLTSVTIPSSVTSIESAALRECCELAEIWVDESNPVFSNDDRGVLFNKDRTTLIKAPVAISGSYSIPVGVTSVDDYAFEECSRLTAVTIPNSVTSIGNWAFYNCDRLTSVAIPDSITTIPECAFLWCSSLVSVIIPDSVTSIECDILSGCDDLLHVFYKGNAEQKNAIVIDEENEDLNDATWHYEVEVRELYGKTVVYCPACDCYYDPNSAPGENLTWTLDDEGTLTISGIGPMVDYEWGHSPWFYSQEVKTLIIEEGVTAIGDGAFAFCHNLASVSIPDSMKTIGERAFEHCENLTSVIIPNSVTTIDDDAFYGCGKLTSVTIPDSVTSIGSSVFESCDSLTGIWVDEDNACYSSDEYGVLFNKDKTILLTMPYALSGDYVVPNGVTEIADEAFIWHENLTSVTIPESVTSIGNRVFYACDSLTGIWVDENNAHYSSDEMGVLFNKDKTTLIAMPCTQSGDYVIPNGVTEIADDAFYSCVNLTLVTIPDSVTSIGYGAFINCLCLSSVIIQKGVTSIGDYAFFNCGLASVTIPGSVTTIGNGAFSSCYGLSSVTIQEGVTSIGDHAFSGCSFTYVTIPDGVVSIEDSVFSGCDDLTSIVIPDSVTSIGYYAFSGCSSLTSIVIPDNVTNIDYGAFQSCTNLANVFYLGDADQKATITMGDNNELLNDTTWHYEVEVREENGKTVFYCTACDRTYDPSMDSGENLIWTLDDEGTLTISGVGAMKDYEEERSPWFGNKEVKKVVIEEGVTSIGEYIFGDCSNLASVTIPDSVTSIGDSAFYGCSSLASITIPDSVNSIGNGTFSFCDSLTEVTIPDGVTEIGASVFVYCGKLASVSIPDSVTSIGDTAFLDCVSLTDVTIPDSVIYIGYGTFYGCIGLTSITIPASVEGMDFGVFDMCENLTEITFMGDAPDDVGYALYGVAATCYYPAGNDTWNESVFESCEGDITWIPYDTEAVLPTITGKSFTLSFEDEILVNFYYTVSDLTDVVEHGMLVFYADPGTVDRSNADAVYAMSAYDATKDRYMATTDGIAAKEMGDTRYYVAYAKLSNGTYVYSKMYDYSPKKYAMNMLGKDTTSDKQKALCVAMLNYGAAAQSYFGYNTDNLMNSGLTDAQKATVIPYDKTLFTGAVNADSGKIGDFAATSTGFGRSATVSFEGAFCVNYYFTPNADVSGDMTLYIWTPEDYAAATTLTAENASQTMTMVAGDDGRYWGQVSGIAAKALDETYYVAGVYTDADGDTYCTGVIAYSLSKYCIGKAVDGNAMQELASATAMYGYYAKAYFG